MSRFVRLSALVIAGALVLAGCRIDVLLEFDQPLPNDPRPATSWLADDVEALPGDDFVGAGCVFDNSSPATGVVAFDAAASVERVLSSCSSIDGQEGSLGAATTADGTVYFVRSREVDPFVEYVYEVVQVPPAGDASDAVVVHAESWFSDAPPSGDVLWHDPVVSPDGSIVLVHTDQGLERVTGPTTRVLIPNTDGVGAGEVRNDGTILATDGNQVLSIAPNGDPTVIAGTGAAGFSGDGGPATAATLDSPTDVTQGLTGVLFVADYGNDRIRRIAADGIISTVAGGGTEDPADGGLARNAQLDGPGSLAYDGTEPRVGDELWVVEFNSGRLLYLGIR